MRAHPLQFLLLVFLLSLPFWLFGSFVSSEIMPGLPVSSLMVVCPTIVAVFLAWREGGYSALRDFIVEAFDWKMSLWVWLVALGTMPLVMILSGLALITLGESLPAPEIGLGQVVVLFVLFFVAAVAEELGWTAYLTRPLAEQYGLLGAALIIGGVAVIWHIIPLLQAERDASWITWWAIGTMCRRVLIVWLYVKGGQKALAASLFHAMNNVSWMLFPIQGSHYDPVSTAMILLIPVLLVVSFCRNSRELK